MSYGRWAQQLEQYTELFTGEKLLRELLTAVAKARFTVSRFFKDPPGCLVLGVCFVVCPLWLFSCLAVLRFYVFDGGHGSLLRPCRVLL